MGRFSIVIRGMSFELVIGDSYIIHYNDDEISFNGHESLIEETFWHGDDGETYFFIWVPEHQEDYLISSKEIKSIFKKNASVKEEQ